MTLGEIINKYRIEHDLSMEKFAQMANISKAYVSMLEKNENPRNGNPIYGANANHALKDFCAEINVTPISPYRLRHTFASIAKNALTEAQLKLTLGHSESMDTGIYIHELEQDHIDTGEAINQLFSKILN